MLRVWRRLGFQEGQSPVGRAGSRIDEYEFSQEHEYGPRGEGRDKNSKKRDDQGWQREFLGGADCMFLEVA
jgi:hypothetical protein